MAAMTDQERATCTRRVILRLFRDLAQQADIDSADLRAAVNVLDDAFDSLIATHLGTDSIAIALNKTLPQPAKSVLTVEQKGVLLAYVAIQKYGGGI